MKIDESRFEEVKQEAKSFYDTIKKVHNPYLNTDIHFNNEGFEHLLTKSWNRGRSTVDQYTRLRLLPKVKEIIKKTTTLQEYSERHDFVRQKINSRWEKRLKLIKYYVFVVILIDAGLRLKLVIKHIEGAKPQFWSVYPSWKVTSDGNGAKRKVFYSGNHEED